MILKFWVDVEEFKWTRWIFCCCDCCLAENDWPYLVCCLFLLLTVSLLLVWFCCWTSDWVCLLVRFCGGWLGLFVEKTAVGRLICFEGSCKVVWWKPLHVWHLFVDGQDCLKFLLLKQFEQGLFLLTISYGWSGENFWYSRHVASMWLPLHFLQDLLNWSVSLRVGTGGWLLVCRANWLQQILFPIV